MGHPVSSDNCLISQKLLLKQELHYPLHVAMGVTYSCLKLCMEFSSQPDLILYKFVYNTVRAHGRENHILTSFRLGVELRDAVCFFGKLYTVSTKRNANILMTFFGLKLIDCKNDST